MVWYFEAKEPVMVTMTGTFDGKTVILDQLPTDIPPNTRVEVRFATNEPRGLGALIAKARPTDTPPDFAAQHEHYARGAPKR
jgi:hypothetical protein